MRLDKYLANAGLGSRKEVKQWIRKGQVCVNGVICKKDDVHIHDEDEILLDGEVIQYDRMVYIMLHKPQGVVSATEDSLHSTVLDCIDAILPKDCFPVGRLDIDTEGLLVITNDGVLAHQLLSPKKHVDKTYYVEIEKPLEQDDINTLQDGVIILDDVQLQRALVEVLSLKAIHLTIREGKFHQVKRMLEEVNNKVTYLRRQRMGSLLLDPSLQVGDWRYLTQEEITRLKQNGQ